MTEPSTKVTADHLRRDPYLYVRQSTLYQVANNSESGRRQYDLRGRAVALGWPPERVVVIDVDQGHSGASAAAREGFQRLVAEVSLGKAGIVLGLECSRLARNNADWHRLLELCALTDTLICDEDGLYDPSAINDRLLLGLKGTMSEAELHYIRARLQGGILAKAKRGELKLRLPMGLVYDPADTVVLDPDASVRQAISHLFATFEATGSALGVVKAFRDEGLKFPGRHVGGPHDGELYWVPLRHDHVLSVLHNPRYAGVYFYGRRRYVKNLQGHLRTVFKPRDQWTVFIADAHPGYISLETFEANQRRLAANAAARGEDRRSGPPREGPALLQGLVICGRCGRRMTVNYHSRCDGTLVPDYACQAKGIASATRPCQHFGGAGIDAAVAALVLDQLSPLAIEAALAVSAELAGRAEDADRIRAAAVERARYSADAARRRYLAVDPANRLVADTLEADWNHKLRELADTQDDYDRARHDGATTLSEAQKEKVRALVTDFPALWADPATPMRERKRLIRLLVTDATLVNHGEHISVHVRLTGGACHTLEVPRPLRAWEAHSTPAATLALIDELLADHSNDETVKILNQRGITNGWGKAFTVPSLTWLAKAHGIAELRQRLRAQGMLTLKEIAAEMGVTTQTITIWHRKGKLEGTRIDGRGACLYPSGQTRPPKHPRRRRPARNDAVTPTSENQSRRRANQTIRISTGGAV
jgi:DNA invertase Pin-like site-specific DNA recombinase